jgi:polar amino acid transport system substrate-binding protein
VEAQPYGVAVAKGKPLLTQQLVSALTDSEADGTYPDLLGRWSLETGAITEFTTNGASDLAAP